MKKYITYLILAFIVLGTVRCTKTGLTRVETKLIMSAGADELMELFVIENYADSLLLRRKARLLGVEDLSSEAIVHLKQRMLATVKDPDNRGVGIAAPQVGISLQMIYVQRLDKENEPFEIYFNPEIIAFGDSVKMGWEGCLSISGYRGEVNRFQNITLNYLDSLGNKQSEKINGFTSVIFQHEVDHINGVLYYDHVENGFDGLIKETN